MTINLLTKLVEVHRGWCNYCAGNVKVCDNCPKGGCTLRDYLQSLSQEAVRDEALEEAARECGICASRQATKHDQKVRDQTRRDLAEAIRALKREPNAADEK